MSNILVDVNLKEISRKEKKESGFYDKYNHAGVYCIYIDDRLSYIGSASDMKRRVSNHLSNITLEKPTDKAYKYKILRLAHKRGHKISFDVLYYSATGTTKDLRENERRLIEEHNPPLNHELPWAGKDKPRELIEDKPWYSLGQILKQPARRLQSAYQ